MEEKLNSLSKTIVNYSLDVKENDRVLITTQTSEANYLIKCLIKEIVNNKGIPFVRIEDQSLDATLLELTNKSRINEIKKHKQFDIDNFDCFISIRYSINDFESSNVKASIRREIGEAIKEIDHVRINERRWVLLNYPSNLDAYKANMKTDDFKLFGINAMCIAYDKMYKDILPLKEVMENTKKVRIVGVNTDITFSIEGMPAIPCCGKYNIPDGEIYTAPIKDSVNGIITFNTKNPYRGYVFSNISLKLRDGKIIDAKASNNTDKLNEILDTDDGARYIGEFAIGLNPFIKNPMGDILFDEKIIGSIHFTPGQAYYDAYNGNDSSIHFDLVLIEREEYGGGELYFDDVLVRKNGKFVLDKLKHLNYENK